MNHEELQNQTIQLGQTFGWRHLHVRRTVGRGKKWTTSTNRKGWPDLFFWHPTRGGVLAAELKIPPDVLSPEQAEVKVELEAAGVPFYVWTPDDLDEQKVAFTSHRGPLLPDERGEAIRLLTTVRLMCEATIPPDLLERIDALVAP